MNAIAERLAKLHALPKMVRQTVNDMRTATGVLVHLLERQVGVLDGRCRFQCSPPSSTTRCTDQIDIALKLLSPSAEQKNQSIEIEVTPDLRTPPMFGAELLSILVNILSNAVKAAGHDGAIVVRGKVHRQFCAPRDF